MCGIFDAFIINKKARLEMSSVYLMKNMTNPPRPTLPINFSDDAMEAKLTETAHSHLQGMRNCSTLSKGQKRREWINLFANSKNNPKASKGGETHRPIDKQPPKSMFRYDMPTDHDSISLGKEEQDEPEDEGEDEPEDGDETEPEDGDEAEPEDGDEAEPEDGDEAEPEDGDEAEPEEKCATRCTSEEVDNVEDKLDRVVQIRQPQPIDHAQETTTMEQEDVRQIAMDRGDVRLASGFSMLNVKQLRERCTQRGLSHAKLKKQELVSLLQRNTEGEE